jgi:trk system potassium uptake protein TrkA
MRVVIVGCGDCSALLASSLLKEGHQVTIIDGSQECFSLLPEDPNLEAIVGEGCSVEVLRRARVEGADAFFALSPDDNKNTMAAQAASHIFRVEKVVCLINDQERQQAYEELGLKVVCPLRATLQLLTEALQE